MGILPLALAVWCMLLERSPAAGLFQSSELRAVTWRACTLSAATKPSQHDTGKANHYREQSRYDLPGSQITVTDGETGHKR